LNILNDIKTAIRLTGEVRKVRKRGASVELRTVMTLPVMKLTPAFLNTIEGPLAWQCDQDTKSAVKAVFDGLPYETRRRLEFTPEVPGEWVQRVRFWQQQLKSVLPPKRYHAVMMKFISWYAHCLRRRRDLERRSH